MFPWFQRKPKSLGESTLWQLECYAFLIEHFGPEMMRTASLATPTNTDFPAHGLGGHELACAHLKQVQQWCRMSAWQVELVAEDPGPAIGESLANYGIPYATEGNDTAGTFQLVAAEDGSHGRITYRNDLLKRPVDFIATMAHELSHFLLADLVDDLPGGEERHEYATDLTAVYLGFGIFQMRSSFRFESYHDGIMTGHSVQRQGYLSRPQLAISLAIFLALKDLQPQVANVHLDDDCRELLRKAWDLLKDRPELAACRRLMV